MATVRNAAQVIRRVRQRLGLSQAALAGLLNATNGAIKHWEHGRHRPNFARLLALQQLCPRGRERAQLDKLIRQTQARVAPLGVGVPTRGVQEVRKTLGPSGASVVFSRHEVGLLRLRRQIARLQTVLQRRNEQLQIVRDRTADLYREVIALRASHSDVPTKKIAK